MALINSQKKTPTSKSNSIKSIIQDFKLLFSKNKTNYTNNIIHIQKILSFCKDIFKNSSNANVFAYFCLHGAATPWVLQNELDVPEAKIYRVLKLFRSKRIIVPVIKIAKTKNSKGGPRPTVWALEGASNDEISTATRLHYKLMSPKYRVAEEVAQTILDEYVIPRSIEEISYREIVIKVKELRIPFRTPDIADLVANCLHDLGIKVWR